MGASSSKAARAAATATTRRYPTRSPSSTTTPQSQPPASTTRDASINLDASDPQFAAALRSLGPVTPNPTLSHSSTFDPVKNTVTANAPSRTPSGMSPARTTFPDAQSNPAVQILTARTELAKRAEEEFERSARGRGEGREFLDVVILRQVLMLRDEKRMEAGEIEKRLGLKRGVVGRLGRKGLVGDTSL